MTTRRLRTKGKLKLKLKLIKYIVEDDEDDQSSTYSSAVDEGKIKLIMGVKKITSWMSEVYQFKLKIAFPPKKAKEEWMFWLWYGTLWKIVETNPHPRTTRRHAWPNSLQQSRFEMIYQAKMKSNKRGANISIHHQALSCVPYVTK